MDASEYNKVYALMRECEKSPHYAGNLRATLQASINHYEWCLWPYYVPSSGLFH